MNPPALETVSLRKAVFLGAVAGGFGWGVRGQYGHETGAMLAGLWVSLVAVLLFAPNRNSLAMARAIALGAIGVSFGGSMTYGQTVGLTHDAPLVGNWPALGWGMLGLFVKGGIWIGLFGVFLGMGLSRVRYSAINMATLFLALTLLLFVGVHYINEPYSPVHRELPSIYFSDSWEWEPDAELRPRFERWGGLLFVLIGTFIYARVLHRDRVAGRLALFGCVFGGLGFAAGQSLQAFHAWNAELFSTAPLSQLDVGINWWNLMETTFGAIMGGGILAGVWTCRQQVVGEEAPSVELSRRAEIFLASIHALALYFWSFESISSFDAVADLAITMGLLPAVAVVGGGLAPYLLCLPLILFPIAGKTAFHAIKAEHLDTWIALVFCAALPLMFTCAAALRSAKHPNAQAHRWVRPWLACSAWLYYALNFVLFDLHGPWEATNFRALSTYLFLVFAVVLTVAACRRPPPSKPFEAPHG